MQVFLDLLGMPAFDAHPCLLGTTFGRLLDSDERTLVERLIDLADECPPNPGPAWSKVMAFLGELGLEPKRE